jgi:hypothetical protein
MQTYGIERARIAACPDPVYGDDCRPIRHGPQHRCRVMLTGLRTARGDRRAVLQFEFARDFRGQPATIRTDEIPFVFGALALAALRLIGLGDVRLSEQMQAYWTNFGEAGDPNGMSLPRWAAFDARRKGYISFTAGGPSAGKPCAQISAISFLRGERTRPGRARADPQ